ncbi:MAG: PAC2 family protein [Fervidicoccaceae archaeon]
MLTIIEKENLKDLSGKTVIVGFPGMAFIGKVTADVLVNKLSLKEVAEIYSYDAPASVGVSEGLIQLPSIKIYSNHDLDLAVLTASYQPQAEEGQNRLAHELSRKLSEIGVRRIISAAAYVTPEVPEKRRVFVAATEKRLVEEFSALGCIPMDGGISGLNGLLPGLAEIYGMEGAALLGETGEFFVAGGMVDYLSVAEIVKVISSYLQLNIAVDELIERAREIEEGVKRAIARSMTMEEKKEKEPSTHM